MGADVPAAGPPVPGGDRRQGLQEQLRRLVAVAVDMDQEAGPVEFLRIDHPDPVWLVPVAAGNQQARGEPLD
ncbi:hypothetical protein E9229_003158 [Paeniglutamicibacter cryotolerans]|uniref:Uncharacterized protein n=1 Tax=Paeniglutamicibacter cryotolerans TaxID=670079 RepID=A0A839QY78_9MICC|nr:hypothetical protein [Paeniglutamicibacter cryotolerans]